MPIDGTILLARLLNRPPNWPHQFQQIAICLQDPDRSLKQIQLSLVLLSLQLTVNCALTRLGLGAVRASSHCGFPNEVLVRRIVSIWMVGRISNLDDGRASDGPWALTS